MPEAARQARYLTKAGTALLVLAIWIPVFALGGVHTPVLCIAAALLAASTFLSWFFREPSRTRRPATVLFVTGVGLTLFTCMQAIPLPAGVVRVISPATAQVWAGALSPLGEAGPTWTSLSLDPTATGIEILRGVAYVCAFLAALHVCDQQGGTRFLSGTIALCATALAVAAMLHPMFGAERVFGVYQPRDAIAERHIAPLLNPNHLAAYLNVGICLALGLALDRRAARVRPIAIAVVLLLIATQVWVASRGGLLSLVFGVTCTLVTWRLSKAFSARRGARLIVPGIVVAAGLAMTVIGASTEVSSELGSTDVSKLGIAMAGLRLVPHHAIFGVGRGAFESAFPAVRVHAGYQTVSHPENLIVQWITEWGLVAAVAGFGALAYALRPRVLATSSSPAIGAWSAIATTAVHNFVDFNSEVPAIGITVAVCAAMVVAGRGGSPEGRLGRWALHPRLVAGTLVAASAVLITLALVRAPHELDEDRATLYDGVRHGMDGVAYADLARAALERHPAEPYFPFIAGVDAAQRGHSIMPWIERTLTLAPVYGLAHLVLAEQLATISPSQARLECRLAMSQAPFPPVEPRAITLGASLVANYDDAVDLLPSNARQRVGVLAALTERLGPRLPATRERLDELYMKLAPTAVAPLERSIDDTLADVAAGSAAPWCDGDYGCVEQGMATADRLKKLDPGSCGPLVLEAKLLIAADRASDGLHALRNGAEQTLNPVECWRSLGDLAAAQHNDVYLQIAEDQVSRSGCDGETECADNLLWIAHAEEARGNARKAIGFYQRAHQKAPERADIVQRWADLAAALGLHSTAMEAYRELTLIDKNPKWQAAADREKSALMGDQVMP